jgi:hypothetical protein
MRAMATAERRQQRDAKKRQRELERQAKEMAKLSALEQARLEVETFENGLDVLLSIHKEQTDTWDWPDIAASLPPVPPRRQSHNELKTRQSLAVAPTSKNAAVVLENAQKHDEREYQDALQSYTADKAEWDKLSSLAHRVLLGEHDAYIEAIRDLSPFTELAAIGSSLHFTVHNARLIECVLTTSGRQAIPSESKSLTASGKVSVKPMPKPRFIEVYQDYVCGCVLRVARELFALLPVETLIVTATAESIDPSTGHMVERPFLSALVPRNTLTDFNFERLDPSDSVLSLIHRGDMKASRKTGDFEFITPLTRADVLQETPERMDPQALLAAAQRLRSDLAAQATALNPEPPEAESANGET